LSRSRRDIIAMHSALMSGCIGLHSRHFFMPAKRVKYAATGATFSH
jgi:hypothetical protein